jgi:hypothetical protein
MARSRRVLHAAFALGALGATLAACNSILGLGNYSVVPEGGAEEDSPTFDTGDEFYEAGAFDSTTDSGDGGDAADVTVEDASDSMVTPDVTVDAAPVLTTLWARWPMPNPDASIAPGADAMLPNQMSYEVNGDGGTATVTDLVTNLTWLQTPKQLGTFAEAASYCAGIPGYQVPTRIQLVSLIDFTQVPTISTATFPLVTEDRFWTSSQVMNVTGPLPNAYWTIDFTTGLAATAGTGHWVLCVQGGP